MRSARAVRGEGDGIDGLVRHVREPDVAGAGVQRGKPGTTDVARSSTADASWSAGSASSTLSP